MIYLITSGQTATTTTSASKDFSHLLRLVEAAAAAEVNFVQLREKNLSGRTLFEVTARAAEIVRSTSTRLLVNDRADIAMGAGAHGVHLTSRSMNASVVRRTFGLDFIVGASTHSIAEARAAEKEGADFVVFGPVFDTASKQAYGQPLGVTALHNVVSTLPGLPILALGGITLENVSACLDAGAIGIAAIRLLQDPAKLSKVVSQIRENFGIRRDG